MSPRSRAVRPIVCALLLAALLPDRSNAAPDDEFYSGKTISIVVTGAGAYETYARTFARYMRKYIPGRPNMIVQGMPGASGLRAANYLYRVAPRDGTVIGAMHGAILTAPLLASDVAQFDVTRFSWIGNATRDTYVGYVWHASPIQSLEDARTRQFIVGGTAVGGAGIDMAIVAKDVFGYRLKIVSGYKSSIETKLAIERGEIEGQIATGWSSLKLSELPAQKKVRVLIQHGDRKHRELPEVPMFWDLARNEAERQMLDVLGVRYEIAKPYFAPPDIPAARLAMLRRAFDATLKDAGFVADMQRLQLELDEPLTGEALSALVQKVSKTPTAIVQRLVTLFANYKDAK